jgi:AraC-like DNA-binding protein
MLDFKVRYAGVHSGARRIKGVCRNNTVNLAVSGVVFRRIYGLEFHEPGPVFLLGIKGGPYETHFSEKCENWHIILDDFDIRRSEREPDRAEILSGDRIVLIPLITPVREEHVPLWRNEMAAIRDAMRNPVPENCLRAELGVANIFRYLLDNGGGAGDLSPASKLKSLIDSDADFSLSLDEMSLRCGLSADHLRTLFKERYRTCPRGYRDRRRVSAAMELMADTNMLVKEIAWRLGFANETAFSAMFKRLTGSSPRAAMRRLRGGL